MKMNYLLESPGQSLWNVGLTDETFSSFLEILPNCSNIKAIKLEGNSLPGQSYYKLITDHIPLAHISLRNNLINDEGAEHISQALQKLNPINKNFVSLNLAFNHISDLGAGYLAEALRLNRSLLSLNLSHNRIADKGALALAEVLGRFPLSHKAIVERRKLLMEKNIQELPRSPTLSRHGDRSERPSNETTEKAQGTSKASKNGSKKKDKEPTKKEEKSTSSLQSSGNTSTASQSGQKKEDLKTAKKQLPNLEQKNPRGKSVKSASKREPLTDQEVNAEPEEITHPLLEPVEFRNGKVFLAGNKVLINLNLLRNHITEKGLKGLLASVETQQQETKLITESGICTGLLRLSVEKNQFSPDNEFFLKLQDLMLSRDPVLKSRS
ncbi:hypothetical protein GDO86_010869 [Hymenochirus boettgeri]|uniref:Leucine rich repeat containing 71 n=1 Tax=Hymenochirus boettgeri TaxID=247094 RepID=A0A8T2JEY3_9PIPI|nr:hypothetical protein GDO86_010869 [Hymenochirus boettgeri]